MGLGGNPQSHFSTRFFCFQTAASTGNHSQMQPETISVLVISYYYIRILSYVRCIMCFLWLSGKRTFYRQFKKRESGG